MNSWLPTTALRRLSSTVFSSQSQEGSNFECQQNDVGNKERPVTNEQLEAESTMSEFLKRRHQIIRQRRESSGAKDASRFKEEQKRLVQTGPARGFEDEPRFHDNSPPQVKDKTAVPSVYTNDDPDDIIQELELIHFLLTELKQRANKCEKVAVLRGYLMMFYSSLITFIRNREEPFHYKLGSNDKKGIEERFDEKFVTVLEVYIKSNLFGLSSNKKDLYLTKDAISQFNAFEERMYEGLTNGLKMKIEDMLKVTSGCLPLAQVLEGIRQKHQYLVSLRLKTIGALREFALEFPDKFFVVDDMIGLNRGNNKVDFSRLPPLSDEPVVSRPKGSLKRSVSFADGLSKKSSQEPKVELSQPSPVCTNSSAKMAFSQKLVEKRPIIPEHGTNCVCEKDLVKFAQTMRPDDLMQLNLKCIVACFVKLSKAKNPIEKKAVSCQTDITFDPKETI